MGWKLSAIFINSKNEINDIELFQNLGFNNLASIESKTFEEVMNPKDGFLYIGNYKGSTIICAPTFYTLAEESLQTEEKALISTFPNSEISTLLLHSVVNFYGFTLIKNGEKIRVKAGSADDGTIVDYGTPLTEELELLKQSKLNDEGERVYILDDYPDEEQTEDQLGEDFVFNVSKRYLGESLDAAEDLLFETKFRGYSYTGTEDNRKDALKIAKRTQWIKYIIYIALFFIIRFFIKYLFDL